MADHVTFFRMRAQPGKRQAVLDLFDKWEREQKGKAPGFVRSIQVTSNEDPDEIMTGVRFDSTANYDANSNRPEINDWYQGLRALLAADPQWFNGTLARELVR